MQDKNVLPSYLSESHQPNKPPPMVSFFDIALQVGPILIQQDLLTFTIISILDNSSNIIGLPSLANHYN